MVLMVYSGARGTLIYEKNLMSKISCLLPIFRNYLLFTLDFLSIYIFLLFIALILSIIAFIIRVFVDFSGTPYSSPYPVLNNYLRIFK